MELRFNMIERTLNAAEVFRIPQKNQAVRLISSNGNEYTANVLPELPVTIAGEVVANEDGTKFSYSVFEPNTGLNFTVKVPIKIEVDFGDKVTLINVQLGVVNGRTVWVKSDDITRIQEGK